MYTGDDLDFEDAHDADHQWGPDTANDDPIGLQDQLDADPMSSLFTLMNEFRAVLNILGDEDMKARLPRVVVVGQQSSGKSSLLDSFLGRQILPRGKGIVTRTPIILTLLPTPVTPGAALKEWCEFKHVPDRKWGDFEKVEREILRRTKELAGDKDILDKPIEISVHSPKVVGLTFVDLPGYVEVQTEGQNVNVRKNVQQLIQKYISKPNTLILTVTPANVNVATSRSVRTAQKVDPSGNNTIGVITKFDLADDLTDTIGALSGRLIPSKHGFITVINQSDDDIKNGTSMQEVRAREERLLREKVPDLAANNGTTYLGQYLVRLFAKCILEEIPEIEMRISQKTKEHQETLLYVGADDSSNNSKIVNQVLRTFDKNLVGEFRGFLTSIPRGRLVAGDQARMTYTSIFMKDLGDINPLVGITNDAIILSIRNSQWYKARHQIPEAAYKDLVLTQAKKLLDPCITCVKSIHENMLVAVQSCLDSKVLRQYPKLRDSIVASATNFLGERLARVIEILETQVAIECSMVLTSRVDLNATMDKLIKESGRIRLKEIPRNVIEKFTPMNFVEKVKDFIPGPAKVLINATETMSSLVMDVLSDSSSSDDENPVDQSGTDDEDEDKDSTSMSNTGRQQYHDVDARDIQVVKKLVEIYFEVIRLNLQDFVPKLVAHVMIDYTCEEMGGFLIDELLTKPEKIEELLQPSEEAKQLRETAKRELQAISGATKVIQKMRNQNYYSILSPPLL